MDSDEQEFEDELLNESEQRIRSVELLINIVLAMLVVTLAVTGVASAVSVDERSDQFGSSAEWYDYVRIVVVEVAPLLIATVIVFALRCIVGIVRASSCPARPLISLRPPPRPAIVGASVCRFAMSFVSGDGRIHRRSVSSEREELPR